jgi:hypothetical protein
VCACCPSSCVWHALFRFLIVPLCVFSAVGGAMAIAARANVFLLFQRANPIATLQTQTQHMQIDETSQMAAQMRWCCLGGEIARHWQLGNRQEREIRRCQPAR